MMRAPFTAAATARRKEPGLLEHPAAAHPVRRNAGETRRRPPVFHLCLAAVIAAALAACESAPEAPPLLVDPYPVTVAPPPEPEPPPEKPRPAPKRPAAKPKAADAGDADSKTALVPPPKPKLEDIVGLTQPEAERLLGAPERQDERSTARIWIYSAGECTLRIFFYPEVESLVFRVLRYEISPASRKESEPSCFDEIVGADKGKA